MDRPTEAEIRAYCAEHASSIYVRRVVAGRWQTVTLDQVPADEYETWLDWWFERGMYPPTKAGGVVAIEHRQESR